MYQGRLLFQIDLPALWNNHAWLLLRSKLTSTIGMQSHMKMFVYRRMNMLDLCNNTVIVHIIAEVKILFIHAVTGKNLIILYLRTALAQKLNKQADVTLTYKL